jgi:hypothetical protein
MILSAFQVSVTLWARLFAARLFLPKPPPESAPLGKQLTGESLNAGKSKASTPKEKMLVKISTLSDSSTVFGDMRPNHTTTSGANSPASSRQSVPLGEEWKVLLETSDKRPRAAAYADGGRSTALFKLQLFHRLMK